jgi:hypothetical protein
MHMSLLPGSRCEILTNTLTLKRGTHTPHLLYSAQVAPVMRAAWPLSLKRCRILLPPSPVLTVSPCCTCLADHNMIASTLRAQPMQNWCMGSSDAGCTTMLSQLDAWVEMWCAMARVRVTARHRQQPWMHADMLTQLCVN